MLSSWSTKGLITCLCCQDVIDSKSLLTSGSICCIELRSFYQLIIGSDIRMPLPMVWRRISMSLS